MKIKILIHKAKEGGFWAEVPSLPGCYSQGESVDEVKTNIREAIEAFLEIDRKEIEVGEEDAIVELPL